MFSRHSENERMAEIIVIYRERACVCYHNVEILIQLYIKCDFASYIT